MHFQHVLGLAARILIAIAWCSVWESPLLGQDAQESSDPQAVQFLQSYFDSYKTAPGKCWRIKWVVEADSSTYCVLDRDEKIWREDHELIIRLGEGMRYQVDNSVKSTISVMDWKESITTTLEHKKKLGAFYGQIGSSQMNMIVGGSCSNPYELGFFEVYAYLPRENQTYYGSLQFENTSSTERVVTHFQKNGNKMDKIQFIFAADSPGNLKRIHKEYNPPTGFMPVDVEIENQQVNGLWFPKSFVVRTKNGDTRSTFESVELIATPKDWLQVTFPKGTMVGNSIQNTYYVVGGSSLSEEDLAKAVELAKLRSGPDSSAPTLAPSSFVRNWPWYLFIAVIPIIGWLIYRRANHS